MIENSEVQPYDREPIVWLQRVLICKSARIDEESEILQDIPFDRGLNLVWADEKVEDLAEIDLRGHSAGKTTLCRFLRYLLGEKTYSNKFNSERIRESFPEGFIAAELRIKGVGYAVRRPFDKQRGSHLAADVSIEKLLEDGGPALSHEQYLSGLGLDSFLDPISTLPIPRSGKSVEWGHLLAWCARDQEARFQNMHDWRVPRTESESPEFSLQRTDGPLFAIRAILGLVSTYEVQSHREIAKLESERQTLKSEAESINNLPGRTLTRSVGGLRECLRKHVGSNANVDSLPLDSLGLFDETLFSLADSTLATLTTKQSVAAEDMNAKQIELEDLSVDIREVLKSIQRLRSASAIDLSAVEVYEASTEERIKLTDSERALLDSWEATCEFGDIAFKDCEHVKRKYGHLPLLLVQDTSDDDLSRAAERERNEAKIEDQRKQFQSQLEEKLSSLASLKTRQWQIRSARESSLDVERRAQDAITELRINIDRVIAAQKSELSDEDRLAIDEKHRQTQEKDRLIDLANKAIIEAQSALDQRRTAIIAAFERCIRGVKLVDAYTGDVQFNGASISFEIDREGRMTGEAVETLRVLLADIACLLYSIDEPASLHPRLLIHDSPREADLGLGLYHNLMAFVADPGSDSEASYQYIMTTTTAPPTDMLDSPYVKLKLNAAKIEELLLKKNISAISKQEITLFIGDESERN